VSTPIKILVPDIGGFKDVSVIDVLVKNGQQVDKESPLITIETEKAAMDVPAPAAGRITEVSVKQGDKVSEGSLILMLEPAGADPAAESAPPPASQAANESSSSANGAPTAAGESSAKAAPAAAADPGAKAPSSTVAEPSVKAPSASARAAAPAPTALGSETSAESAGATSGPVTQSLSAPEPGPATRGMTAIDEGAFSKAYASPSVRKFARELGADLGKIQGTGPKARITQEDVKARVKQILTAPPPAKPASAAPATGLPRVPEVDFAKFGPVELKPLSRIQKISGSRLQASWVNLPHVTQHDDADITDLEDARKSLRAKAEQEGVKVTPLAFIIRACIAALKEFPRFNASLDSTGENLVVKKYFHIGFAADTPNGLVVPVIRDADSLNLYGISRALADLSSKARAGKLKAVEMQGGTFTISSLGGIGGSYFTPIINAPEVAILGVSKSSLKPVYERGAFVPRLMLPLSLSYDHRVIDGAEAARFVVFLSKTLSDAKGLV
jgi:pyruvate dehydrogenase E2 component (dihydrolipoamide acetyltransferase)